MKEETSHCSSNIDGSFLPSCLCIRWSLCLENCFLTVECLIILPDNSGGGDDEEEWPMIFVLVCSVPVTALKTLRGLFPLFLKNNVLCFSPLYRQEKSGTEERVVQGVWQVSAKTWQYTSTKKTKMKNTEHTKYEEGYFPIFLVGV